MPETLNEREINAENILPVYVNPRTGQTAPIDVETGKVIGGASGAGFIKGQSGNPKGRPKRKLMSLIYEACAGDPATAQKMIESIKAIVAQPDAHAIAMMREMRQTLEPRDTDNDDESKRTMTVNIVGLGATQVTVTEK